MRWQCIEGVRIEIGRLMKAGIRFQCLEEEVPRPFNYEEIIRMLKTNDGQGDWFRVSDVPREVDS